MAVTRTMRPRMILFGVVLSVNDLKRKADGAVYGREVVIKQDHDSFPAVKFFERNYADLPSAGEVVAYVVELGESKDFGAELSYYSPAYSQLDAIHAALVPSGK